MALLRRYSIPRHTRLLRLLLCACVAGAGVQALLLTQPVAHASVGPCASDPFFIFSNGTVLDVDTVITDISDDIQQVVFTIHVPAGTQLVFYVAGALGAKESWSVLADEAPGNYATVTYVHAATSGIPVHATTTVTGLIGAFATMINGYVQQDLIAHATI